MPLSLIYTIKDGKGARSTVEINLDVTTLANAQTFLTAHAPLLDALILGYIERVGICASGVLPGGLSTVAVEGSDVEEGALFMYNSVGGYHTRVRIPTFDESKMVVGSQRVDLTDADVIAWNAAMISPLATFSATDYRGADIISLRSALDSFQRSRRNVAG